MKSTVSTIDSRYCPIPLSVFEFKTYPNISADDKHPLLCNSIVAFDKNEFILDTQTQVIRI